MPIDVTPLGPLNWDVPSIDAVPERTDREPAPLFAADSGFSVQDPADEITSGHLARLRSGEAGTVVTGQQPGRLVGPLYTLFKIATAVELAGHLTRGGRPTVPVFWSGDADDDLDEAMAPLCWDPLTRGFLDLPGGPGRKHPGRRDPMVGRLAAADSVGTEAAWLQAMASERGHPLARDLADLWRRAIEEKMSWSELQHRAVTRIFKGSGLVVLSGDDPVLHRAADPLYREIIHRLPELADAGRVAGSSAPIGNHSWRRPLFRVEGSGRVPLEPGSSPDDLGDLRPGVVFRSPVQDWLLRPSAVVVGPGELAYLKQLGPVYRSLGILRSPLVPRMSGWLLPDRGVEPDLLAADETPEGLDAGALAARVASAGREELERALVEEIGLDGDRARELSRSRTRRWLKGLEAMLRDEVRRARDRRIARHPDWVFPRGGRQERTLAAGCALALWGEPLLEAIMAAADRHCEAGSRGDWRTLGLTVTDPSEPKGSP